MQDVLMALQSPLFNHKDVAPTPWVLQQVGRVSFSFCTNDDHDGS